MKYILFLLFISATTFAQNDSINLLDEVKLHGNLAHKINCGYNIKIIKDSVLNNNVQSLGNLLQQEANLYFKQNGNGMVSSISLRGTGASHTGVYWNGIAINSSLNGQTDFNTLSANGFDEIEIRKGAGSTLFGSGAIGGLINLKDKVHFNQQSKVIASIGIASYNTQNIFISSSNSFDRWFYKISIDGVKSDNDFPYLDTDLINENAKLNNFHTKTIVAYKFDAYNQLKLFSNSNKNKRELARSLTAPSKSLYKNEENNLLLDWINTGSKHNGSLKLAYLNETYAYYYDKDIENFTHGRTDNYILKYDFTYFIKNQQNLQVGIENRFTQGNGTSITKTNRNIFESYALYHHKPLKKLMYNASLRKGFSSVYNIPLIYSLDALYTLNKNINIRANYSSNYKLPTFNDLFWEFSGNENLKPENSISVELGVDLKVKNFNSSMNVYQIKSTNLIQWRPVTSAIWKPINIQEATALGFEFDTDYKITLKNHRFKLKTQYSFTKSVDESLEKQLIYVPFHKATGNFNYSYKGWQFNYNTQFTSHVFTTTSNTLYVPKYWLHHIQFHKNIYKNKINIGFYINNLLNKSYQTVAFRPMPNRNYKLNIKIKI